MRCFRRCGTGLRKQHGVSCQSRWVRRRRGDLAFVVDAIVAGGNGGGIDGVNVVNAVLSHGASSLSRTITRNNTTFLWSLCGGHNLTRIRKASVHAEGNNVGTRIQCDTFYCRPCLPCCKESARCCGRGEGFGCHEGSPETGECGKKTKLPNGKSSVRDICFAVPGEMFDSPFA